MPDQDAPRADAPDPADAGDARESAAPADAGATSDSETASDSKVSSDRPQAVDTGSLTSSLDKRKTIMDSDIQKAREKLT